MTTEIVRKAWKGEPPPTGCNPSQYIALRSIYREYRKGNLERETAKFLKEKCMSFEDLPPEEKISLLTYAVNSELDNEQLGDIKRLVLALISYLHASENGGPA